MSDDLTFAVSLFKRIFQTEPERQAWTLQQLIAAMTTFEVKRDTWREIRRELDVIGQAEAAIASGRAFSGRHYSQLVRARKASEKAGGDGAEAVELEAAKLRKEAHKRAKKGQRGWSPVLYPPGVKRGADVVIHVSCLVLDHDDGTPIAEATTPWEDYFHIVHTTWSHTPEHPKFRVVLPLAEPVLPQHWPAVWKWTEARVGHSVDLSSKSIGRIYGLPTVRTEDWPRDAYVHGGELADFVVMGIVPEAASRVSIDAAGGGEGPGEPDFVAPSLPPELSGGMFDDDPPVATRDTGMSRRVAEIERRLGALEKLSPVAAELERLNRLHQSGALDAAEFAAAKRIVLAGH
jgi:hypothetical protein